MRPCLTAIDYQKRVIAGQRVVRGGIEPPTFRFSGGRSYQLSYLTLAGATEASILQAPNPDDRSGPDGI
jgi:hypothetical protein